MKCSEFRDLLPEMPPPDSEASPMTSEAQEHTRNCPSCAVLSKQHQALRGGLRQLAAERGGLAAPARVEAALLQQFRAEAELPRKPILIGSRRPVSVFAPLPAGILSAGALAAALAAFLLWSHPPGSRAVPEPVASVASVSSPVADADENAEPDNEFIPLPYFGNSGLIPEPEAEADVVEVEMPRSALVALGVPVAEEGSTGPVQAELLLGAGGMPQAVRILE
jgi:hypothetical protein